MKFLKNPLTFGVLILVFVLIILTSIYFYIHLKSNKTSEVSASSASATLTTKANWDAGTLDNIDTATAEGSMEILDKAEAKIDTTGMTATSGEPIDGNLGTYYGAAFGDPIYWEMDFGQEYYISRVITKKPDTYMGSINYSYSTNGVDWTSEGFTWDPASGGVVVGRSTLGANVRYLKFDAGPPTPPTGWKIYEYEFYGAGLATHTTGATQIDGGANFWRWDSNTITQSVPVNTSVTYRYRTSADGGTWTGWVGSIASVTSRTGDDSNNPTRYRYLQIEATLANTDGASTPTIDQYDIDYHTEVKPTAPTAQTAVAQ